MTVLKKVAFVLCGLLLVVMTIAAVYLDEHSKELDARAVHCIRYADGTERTVHGGYIVSEGTSLFSGGNGCYGLYRGETRLTVVCGGSITDGACETVVERF